MRQSLIAFLALSAGIFAPAASQPQDMAALVRSLDLDPPLDLDVECLTPPPEAQQVLFAAVFVNRAPIAPDSAEFPSGFCPEGTQFYARADGRGNSSLFGEFVWWERYCAGAPGGLFAEGYFEGTTGGRVDWTALVRPDEDSPSLPFRTFSGTMTFTGGTGRFAGVSGAGAIAAKQLGDSVAERRPGSTAAAVCGWIKDAAG